MQTHVYCGNKFSYGMLSGPCYTFVLWRWDTWTNVVTACKRCNNAKGGRTPEEANMMLVVAFSPSESNKFF